MRALSRWRRAQAIELAVLAAQIGNVRGDRHRLAGSALDDLVGRELAPVPVEPLLQPSVQRCELAARHLLADLGMRLQRCSIELGAQDVADGVALEAAAHVAAVPVHILQAAVAIVRRLDAEVGLEARAPGFGQVLHLEPPLQQIELQIEAQHDVQVVRHLVGVGADQRALDLVDGAIEGVERHLVRTAPGKASRSSG